MQTHRQSPPCAMAHLSHCLLYTSEAVIRNLKENLKGFVGVAVVILILSVICASYFAWSISNPLGKLTASMSLMKANGKFKNIEVNSNLKEINTLEITYNAMAVSYTHLDVYKRQCEIE